MHLKTGHKRAARRRKAWDILAAILNTSPRRARKLCKRAFGRHRNRRPQLVDDKPPPF